MSIQSKKVYHLVPERVEGTVLMPLNQLKGAFPQLYERHSAKYKGREDLMLQPIPHFNCLWNDVLQFSPVHPEQIRDALVEVGFGWRPMLFFEMGIDEIGINSSNSLIFLHQVKERGFAPDPDEYIPYSDSLFERCSALPQATRDHFKKAKENNEPPLLFLWVPHLLFRGTVDVTNLKIVEI